MRELSNNKITEGLSVQLCTISAWSNLGWKRKCSFCIFAKSHCCKTIKEIFVTIYERNGSIFAKIIAQNERRTYMFEEMLLIFAKVFAKIENNQMILQQFAKEHE